MHYMIRFEASLEAGSKIDRSGGGADAAIGAVIELLKPETFYVSLFKRELFIIVNTDDLTLLSEAVHLIMLVAGCQPEVTPILTAGEAMQILPPSIGGAVSKAVELRL